MTVALARSLVLADAITNESLAVALLAAASHGVSLLRALVAMDGVDWPRVQRVLDAGDAPYMNHVAPVTALVDRLPPKLCERLFAVPVRRDARTGTVDLAVVDATDPHPVAEVAHWLAAPIRVVRTSLITMQTALEGLDGREDPGFRSLAPPIGAPLSAREAMHALDAGWGAAPASSVLALPPLGRASVRPPHGGSSNPPPMGRRSNRTRRPPSAPDPADGAQRPTPPPKRRSLAPGAPLPSFDGFLGVVDEMRWARGRDDVLELLVAATRTVARKVAVLAVQGHALVGWTGSPELGDGTALRRIHVATTLRTMLGVSLESRRVRFARIPGDDANGALVALMSGREAADVAMVTVHVESRPAAVVIASEFGDALKTGVRMQEAARTAGESLALLLRQRRK